MALGSNRGASRFQIFIQGFHNWILNPFHMMSVVGINVATVERNIFEDDRGSIPLRCLSLARKRGLI